MSTEYVDLGGMIVQTSGTCGGELRIDGHRITVRNIVVCDRHGDTPEEILEHYPTLSLAQVHAALAFYHLNREALDVLFDAQEGEEQELARQFSRAHGTIA